MSSRQLGSAAMRALAHPTRIALLEALHIHDTLTATEASEIVRVTPTNCAFHLRTLARFGFVEQAGTGPGRRRPWRALSMPLVISDVQENEQDTMAARALSDVLIQQWIGRIQRMQAARHGQAPDWLEVLGGSQALVYATADEIRAMVQDIRAVLSRYDDRLNDPARRPTGHRVTELLLFTQLYEPAGYPPPDRDPLDPSTGTTATTTQHKSTH
ncbi:helix-turn-helix domain-containing protein [Actinoplanes sichuanensis]|uniref:Winged helix-turn-helix domain-containing protein n=1 Tax=Actinoplanes sichuanensis TaxID=512349 RepID=A0ABW4ATS5_9ACTN|nr:helix-turn-helix domain-containing protein [Actinoplanes sichuanensis]BEL04550.1 helix-turn-helix domain-containing protein [Actinoplanes sichuanensis]